MEKNKFFTMAFFLILSSCVIMSGCQKNDNASAKESAKEITIAKTGLLPDYSPKELEQRAELIVLADFHGYGDAFMVKPTNGGDISVFRDADFEVKEILKNDSLAGEGKKIVLRVEGGTINGTEGSDRMITVKSDMIPEFQEDQEYLLYLSKPKHGGPFITKGDYYRPIGLANGIFAIERGWVFNINTVGRLDPNKSYSLEEMKKELGSKAPTKVKTMEERMLEQRNSGNITQAEYEEWNRTKEEYATIVE